MSAQLRGLRVLFIDCFDSFSYNIVQELHALTGVPPRVLVHTSPWRQVRAALAQVDCVVLSPGPGHPANDDDFGVCGRILAQQLDLLQKDETSLSAPSASSSTSTGRLPVLGICLGMQGIVTTLGGRVTRAIEPRHGRVSRIRMTGEDSVLLRDLDDGFAAVRYNSLVVEEESVEALAGQLKVTARDEANGEIMAVEHCTLPVFGVQFHPESVCTEGGRSIFASFLQLVAEQLPARTARPDSAGVDSEDEFKAAPRSMSTRMRLVSYKLDLSAPVDSEHCFMHLFADLPSCWWLDSSKIVQDSSRFSFMGAADGPLSQVVSYDVAKRQLDVNGEQLHGVDLFDWLETRLDELSVGGREYRVASSQLEPIDQAQLPFSFKCGFVGYLGYEMKAQTLSVPEGPLHNTHHSRSPDAWFLLADRAVVFDHAQHDVYLIALEQDGSPHVSQTTRDWFDATATQIASLAGKPPSPVSPATDQSVEQWSRFSSRHGRDGYIKNVEACVSEICAGESYELCLTNQLEAPADGIDPLSFYQQLRRVNPAPYAGYLRCGDNLTLTCSSPERFIRIDEQRWAESKPIKGTAPRGATPEEDRRLRDELASSEKDRAENLMIVDLSRNDLGRVCDVGSVSVPKLMHVESYATVHQLVSTVRGHLQPSVSAVQCVKTAFPPGSMTGAPKRRSVEILQQLEQGARGVYSGSLGFLSTSGAVDLNVVIRTAVWDETADHVSIGTGGAIVYMSDPEAEYEEMRLKARALMRALSMVNPALS